MIDDYLDFADKHNITLRIHGPISPQASHWAKADNRTKKELEKKILDLQAKAQNAEVKLKSSTEEVDKLKNIVGSFQKQIEEIDSPESKQPLEVLLEEFEAALKEENTGKLKDLIAKFNNLQAASAANGNPAGDEAIETDFSAEK
mgnify:CR=1 FL=1